MLFFHPFSVLPTHVAVLLCFFFSTQQCCRVLDMNTLCITLYCLDTTEIPIDKAGAAPVGKLTKKPCLDEGKAAQLLFHPRSPPLATAILLSQLCKNPLLYPV